MFTLALPSLRRRALAFAFSLALTGSLVAAADAKITFDVPAGEARDTLKRFAQQAGREIVYPPLGAIQTNAVKGELTVREALDRLLAGTSLAAFEDAKTGGMVVRRRDDPKAQGVAPSTVKSDRPAENKSSEAVLRAAAALRLPADRNREEAIVLSPFEVVTDKDDGFAAANAGTATRLALDMRDVPAPFSAMTRDFIDALVVTNFSEAASWATNGSAWQSGAAPADLQQQPSQFNTRGADSNSGQQRNNYLTSGLLDSYALERYEFGRGPNAALFNIGSGSTLAGGLGSQTKRPRYDRSFDTVGFTYGSWDYQRATLDVNRPLSNKVAVRGNAVWFDRNGYRLKEFERTKGVTLAGSYLITPKTEIRLEGAYDKTARNFPGGYFDFVSGWDGTTVYRGPVTNAMLGTQTVPGAPNSFGQVLTFQGQGQGIDRRSGEYYIWDPFSGQNMIMNYQNEAFTRKADETVNTPILANGVLYTRGNGLPFGNGSGSQTPTATQNPGGDVPFLYQINLPPDRFNRIIAGSAFRLPNKQFTVGFDSPLYVQDMKDVNLTLAHQVGDRWFFELGGDINRVYSTTARDGAQNVRLVRIDINQLLPNGAPNIHFLQPYGDAPIGYVCRNFLNRSVRGNLAHRLNAGKWGNYTLNLNLASSLRTTEMRIWRFSVATLPDPRMWQSAAQVISIRQYWNSPARPYGDGGVPTGLSQNVFATDNNSYTTTNRATTPRWTLGEWDDTDQKFDNAVVAVSARYFGGKVAVLAAQRYDRFKTQLFSRMEYGDLPATWDGNTRLYKPTAPADWATLSYIPRNATTGVATATKPVPAATRPRQNPPGVTSNNGVQIYNPFFAGDRFRNDYSPPVNSGNSLTGTYGVVYHALKHVSLVANHSTSYVPAPANAFTINNELVEPVTGRGYDGGLRFRFFEERLTVNTSYFHNIENNQRVDPPTKAPINSLLSRNAANDPSLDGRNVQGIPDIFGTDYQSVKNSGVELEVVGRIARGWRVMFNLGTARALTSNRWPQAKTLVPQNADLYRQVLEDAGGRLDTTQHPNGAPGLAVINPAVSAAIASEQSNAVNDYNSIWANYALVANQAPILRQNRTTINTFSDYTIQSGRFKGLRLGLGGQFPGKYLAGFRSGDTIVNPANPTQAIDDPSVGQATPIYENRHFIVTMTLGYTMRLKQWKRLEGKELTFQMVIRNLLNDQMIKYDGQNMVPRPPNGDFTKPNRVTVPVTYSITEPTSVLFTTTLRL